MKSIQTPDQVIQIEDIYDKLLRRYEDISIALRGTKRVRFEIKEKYDISHTGSPSVGETEFAFYKWDCAILTAFRNVKGLSKEENLARNKNRNEELKGRLIHNSLLFRSVPGRYREEHWEEYVEEMCFFVTNTDESGSAVPSIDSSKVFFCKIYSLAKDYEQDSFLFTLPGANRIAFLVASNDAAKKEFRGDFRFAGPLFTHVDDIGAWTECSDGKISFRLKGMILRGGLGNKQIQIGEGDLFDVKSYNPDGIIVIRKNRQTDLKRLCQGYTGVVPLIEHVLPPGSLSIICLKREILQALTTLCDQKCQCISIHCSASVYGSYLKGAEVFLNTIREWARENKKRFKEIILVDIYGEYSKILAQ